MIETYALGIELAGLAVFLVGWFWLLIRAFRRHVGWGIASLVPPVPLVFGVMHWRKGMIPISLILLGSFIVSFPPLYSLLVPIDLGPRERMVEGERHLTLTGWDRTDYALLGSKRDVVLLQMANPDVSDETLKHLKGLHSLRELDLSNTQVTDTGLNILRDLPVLETLRLKNTRITDRGFANALSDKASLKRLDLTGTEVSQDLIRAWCEAQPGRRVMR